MSNAFERHSPDWVQKAFQEAESSKTCDPEMHATFLRILAVHDVGSVWRAIERRLSITSRPDWHLEECALALVQTCAEAIAGFSGANRLSHSDRSVVATRVGAACKDLIGLLKQIGYAETGHLSDAFESMRALPHVFWAEASDRIVTTDREHEAYKSGFESGVYKATVGVQTILSALAKDAVAWSVALPVVARPNRKNAARTFFVRQITSYFCSEYGSPLRQPTLLLTSAFFDVGDLDVSTIAKLAPRQDGSI